MVERRERVIAIWLGSTGNGKNPMFNGRRQPSIDGTSRMMREYQVRICERLGVKFLGPTRHSRLNWVTRAMSGFSPWRPWRGHPRIGGFVPLPEVSGSYRSFYSITSSAIARRPGGIVSASALAVLRLTTNWNLLGCSTGSSAGFSHLENALDIAARKPISIRRVDAIAHQSAGRRILANLIHHRHRMADLKRNQLITTAVEKRFRRDRRRPNVLARYEIEGRVEFGRRAGAQDKDLFAKSVCRGLNLMNLVGGTRKAGINQNANGLRIWDQIVQQRESLGFKRRGEDVHTRGVLRWAD